MTGEGSGYRIDIDLVTGEKSKSSMEDYSALGYYNEKVDMWVLENEEYTWESVAFISSY